MHESSNGEYLEYTITNEHDLTELLNNGIETKCKKCCKNITVGDQVVGRLTRPTPTKLVTNFMSTGEINHILSLYHRDCFRIVIPKESICKGISKSNTYARYLLDQAKELHKIEKFQISIPLATLSFEESSKMDSLIEFLDLDMLDYEWDNLHDHNVKTVKLEKNMRDFLKAIPENSSYFNEGFDKFSSIGLNNVVFDKQSAIKLKQKMQEMQSKFPKIREMCFYSDWNKRKSKWISFQDIPKTEQLLLGNLVNFVAEEKLLLTEYILDVFQNAEFDSGNIKNPDSLKSIKKLQEFEKNTPSVEHLLKYEKIINRHFSN